MQFGVPVSEYIDIDTDDIEFEYRWFDNIDDARAFARTGDSMSRAIDNIIEIAPMIDAP